MTPAEGVKRAAQALSLLWPFAVIAAVSFGRMSLLLAVGLPLFAFQALFILRKGIRGASIPALLISIIGTAVCGLGLLLSEAALAFWYPVFVNLALLLALPRRSSALRSRRPLRGNYRKNRSPKPVSDIAVRSPSPGASSLSRTAGSPWQPCSPVTVPHGFSGTGVSVTERSVS